MPLFPCQINSVFVSTDNIRQERKGNYSKSSPKQEQWPPKYFSARLRCVFRACRHSPEREGLEDECPETILDDEGVKRGRDSSRPQGVQCPEIPAGVSVYRSCCSTFLPSGLRWSGRMSCINLKAVGPVNLIAPHERHISDLFICGHALGGLFLLNLYTSLYEGNDRITRGKRN